MDDRLILSVSQINLYIKSLIDGDQRLAKVIIRGEISNFTNHYRTGHYYLTLKDDNSSLRAVMFKSNVAKIKFIPENGMSVIAVGRISVFERDGQYQLYLDDMQPDGAGALAVAFEQLKEKLGKEGLFDQARKKPLPPFPESIGVITSPTGAAVKDILNVLARRYPPARVVFAGVLVQGEGAPGQMIDALNKMNSLKCCDVIIIGRGGGSAEELWAFNDEYLARAVAASAIPVISAVGHETDFTICDFAADLRAPTPSAAAELATPDVIELGLRINHLRQTTTRLMGRRIAEEKSRLRTLAESAYMSDPMFFINTQKQILDGLHGALIRGFSDVVNRDSQRLKLSAGKLDSLSPLKVLGRGYSIVSLDGRTITGAGQIKPGDIVDIRLNDGSFSAGVLEKEL